MKLPIPALTLAEQLAEFDVWITPSLGEIKDTDKFRQQLDGVVRVFEILDEATHDVYPGTQVAKDFASTVRVEGVFLAGS